MVVCAGCERPILDRFLLNVLDRAWHAKCVQCVDCQGPLTEKCFSRDGKLYCRDDFFRRFGTKCGGCSQGISPNDLVRKARNKVFHLKCFTCMVCRKQLSTGEELYVLDENKFICKDDYLSSKYHGSDHEDNEADLDSAILDKMDDTLSEKELSMELDGEDSRDSLGHSPHNGTAHALNAANNNNSLNSRDSSKSSPDTPIPPSEIKQEQNNNNNVITNNNNNSSNSNSNSDAEDNAKTSEKGGKDGEGNPVGAKRRGPRTTIKAKQLETLKAAFAATPKPTRHIREQLAQETGLNMRVIQVWFQNRRSKERRMKQLSALGARRHFFRNPRRMRGLRPGELDEEAQMMGQPGFNYFAENGDFYPGYPGYNDFYPGQGEPGGVSFLPGAGPQGTPPLVDHGMGPEGQFAMGPHDNMGMPPTSSPEPLHLPPHDFVGPPRSLAATFGQQLHHGPPEMTAESW